MSTVLAYASPTAAHAFPLVPGLLALRARGHSVQLRTAPDLASRSRPPASTPARSTRSSLRSRSTTTSPTAAAGA